jgi:tetratricopeptide (TPR) repeat protein
MPKLTAIILLFLLSVCIQDISKKFVGLKYWQEAYRLYKCELYSEAAEEYLKANKSLPQNGLLKQMYGKCLALDKKWEDAKKLLQDALLKRTDSVIYQTLGDVCNELDDMKMAEFSYVQAGFIEPHKFYPQYLLVKLYLKKGQKKDAINNYRLLLTKKIKVSSIAIDEMKNELKQILGE